MVGLAAVTKSRGYHHVFQGEVRLKQGNWVASGWHHRFMGQDAVDRRVSQVVRKDVNGCYAARIEMKAPDGQWVSKPTENSFFPDNWTPQYVAHTIHEAFANGHPIPNTRNRWEGFANGVSIQGSYNPTGKNWDSAWPIILGRG